MEWCATVLALASVWLSIRQKRLGWVFGGLSAALYVAVLWRSGLHFQSLLQLLFIVLAAVGWFSWGRDGELRVVSKPVRFHLGAGLVWAVVLAAASAAAMGGKPNASSVIDAATAIGSVLAVALQTRKIRESWLYWIVIDLASAALFFSQQLYPTAGLYLVFTVLAAQGYREWGQTAPPAAPQDTRAAAS